MLSKNSEQLNFIKRCIFSTFPQNSWEAEPMSPLLPPFLGSRACWMFLSVGYIYRTVLAISIRRRLLLPLCMGYIHRRLLSISIRRRSLFLFLCPLYVGDIHIISRRQLLPFCILLSVGLFFSV
jgi:hypothetical protein